MTDMHCARGCHTLARTMRIETLGPLCNCSMRLISFVEGATPGSLHHTGFIEVSRMQWGCVSRELPPQGERRAIRGWQRGKIIVCGARTWATQASIRSIPATLLPETWARNI